MPRLSLAAQLGIILLGLATGLGVSVAVFHEAESRAALQTAGRQLELVAGLKVGQIEQWQKDRLATVAALQRNEAALGYLEGWLTNGRPTSGHGVLLSWLDLSHDLPETRETLLLAPDGKVLLSTTGENEAPADALRQLPAVAVSRVPRLTTGIKHQDQAPRFDLIIPLFSSSTGNLLAFAVLRNDQGVFLKPLLDRWPVDQQSAGTLFVQSHQGRWWPVAGSSIRAGFDRMVARAMANDSGAQIVRDPAFPAQIVLGRALGNHQALVVHISEREVLEPASRRLGAMVVGSALLLAAAFVALFWVWRRQHQLALNARSKELEGHRRVAELRARLDEAQSLSHLGYWERNLETQTLWWSDECFRIFGHHPGLVAPTFERFINAIHPDDRERLLAISRACREEGKPYDTAYRILLPTGAIRHVHARAHVTRDKDGRPQRLIGTVLDITDRKAAETALRRQTLLLETVIQGLPQGITVFDENLHLLLWNDHTLDILKLPREAVYHGAPFASLIRFPAERGEYGPGDPNEQIARRVELASQFKPHRFERASHDDHAHLVEGKPFQIDGQLAGFITTYTDITERKRIENAIQQQNIVLQSVLDNIPCGVSMFNSNLELVLINERCKTLLDFPPELFAKTKPSLAVFLRFNAERGEYGPGDKDKQVASRLARAATPTAHHFERARPDGTVIEVQGTPLPGGGFVTVYNDITSRHQAERHIEHLAHHDPLTGLPNRYTLDDRLSQAFAKARRSRTLVGVMFIDLDRFKTINDSLGHAAGDQLLIEVAHRLKEALREIDTVARLGGDEFVVMAPGLHLAEDTLPLVHRILEQLGHPYDINGVQVHATPSIGISLYPQDGTTPDTITKNADTAMYHAKEGGRNGYRFFAAQMNAAAEERLAIESGLRQAIARHELSVHYQPIFDTNSHRLVAAEALVRWHPMGRHHAVPPDTFIPVAEETGLINHIGRWVLETACHQAVGWLIAGLPPLILSVNVSPQQLRHGGFADNVRSILAATGYPPDRLQFEVTENGLMERIDQAAAVLKELRSLGVHVAVDDFGTGFSSLTHLRHLPLDTLKIDRSFVSDIEQDANDRAIAISTVALAHSLGLKVVAEGVETKQQLDFLSKHGCDLVQGYLFARPMPHEAMAQRLAQEPLD